jgi:hypothetical protein
MTAAERNLDLAVIGNREIAALIDADAHGLVGISNSAIRLSRPWEEMS